MARTPPRTIARRGGLVVERDARRPGGRLLLQAEMEASYVDLADPAHLEFDYMRWMRIVLRAARARRVLHIGGGACALARALAAEDPAGRQEVCEVDEDVLELAREHLGLRRAPGLRVRHAEGRECVASKSDGSFDAIAIDAFVGARIPRHLITVEALSDVARVAPLALVNVVDGRAGHEVRTVAAGLAETFPRVCSLGARAGNTVLVGSLARLDLARVAALAAADVAPAGLRAGGDWLRGAAPLRDAEARGGEARGGEARGGEARGGEARGGEAVEP